MPDVEGLVLLVSGAASGIGRATLDLWRQHGGLGLGLDLDIPATPTADLVRGDVTSEVDVERAVTIAVDRFGRLDAVFHCAGVLGPAAPVTELGIADWNRVLAVHLTGAFLLAKQIGRAHV